MNAKPGEAAESIASGTVEARGEHHLVIFLPFLRLGAGHTVAGVEFLPLRDANGKTPAVLEAAVAPLDRILSGYIDRHGEPCDNCVVATVPGRSWDLSRDDFPTVTWAASLLFLASWACNDYYPRFGRHYVNSSNFRVVGQAFSGTMPGYIAVSARRRDGNTTDGGYKHGEFKFSLPLQVSVREPANIDVAFLAGLNAAHTADSSVIGRLRTALPFVELANTDEDFMNEHAEAILMGSAFEQLLAGDASAYKLGKKFGKLFEAFGSATVEDVKRARPGIEIDTSSPEIAAAQPKWWVHRKWMEELYDVRSKVVHKGHHAGRQWGWAVGEHLVMAAHVFPLTVKLLLEPEGHYTLTDDDRARCLAVDALLAATQWVGDRDDDDRDDSGRSWHETMSKVKRNVAFDKAFEAVKMKYPDLFKDDPAATTQTE